ncbi:WbuC family cupin fold metalloprotein, partial [Enterobacter hormaechei]|uniref:WbuC family cupin fold metalloprotein n=1 Tax=Enterobacter hormaechei TaxID=158836 RepID=UPI00359CFBBD
MIFILFTVATIFAIFVFINFIPGTYVRPHRHPHTFELLLPLRGRFVVLNFDDRGTVTHRAILG